MHIIDETSLSHAVSQLQLLDPLAISEMIAVAGPPPLRKRSAGLAGLIRIIISQQVSTASADAIHQRFSTRFARPEAGDILAATDADLQSCGLSMPKVRTLRHLATAIHSGELDLERLHGHDTDTIQQALTRVKGIGPWTADVYLLFCLGHPDVWPAGDLALQEGVRIALKLRKRPDAARLEKISKRWRPWRAVAARIIWAYYGINRQQAVSAPGKRKTRQRQNKAGSGAREGKASKPASAVLNQSPQTIKNTKKPATGQKPVVKIASLKKTRPQ